VTVEVSRYRQLRPTPITQCRRKELQPAARCWKTTFDRAVEIDSNKAAAFFITIRQRQRNDVWTSRFRPSCEDSAEAILARVIKLCRRNNLFVNSADLFFH